MHSFDFEMSESSSTSVPNFMLQNGRKIDETWDHKPIVTSLSRMNSVEWDYTIELECLNGPQG